MQNLLNQQKVNITLLRYLGANIDSSNQVSPEEQGAKAPFHAGARLTNLVLKYCWPVRSDDVIISSSENIRELCLYGNYEKLMELSDNQKTSDSNWSWGFCWTCRGGHMKIFQLIVDHCKKLSKPMRENFGSKKSSYPLSWNEGFYRACKGGHIDIIESCYLKIMRNGGTSWNDIMINWNWGVYWACAKKRTETIIFLKKLFSKGKIDAGCCCKKPDCLY